MSALTVLNPATAQPIATLERADVAEVDAAVSRAVVAQRRWAALPPGARADTLRAFARVACWKVFGSNLGVDGPQ